jgi:hypothetical protein
LDNHNLYNNYNNFNDVIFFNNTTTSKAKSKIFENNKYKENIRFTENSNTIFKTKAKTKVKNTEIIKKESSDIKSILDKDSNIKAKNQKIYTKTLKMILIEIVHIIMKVVFSQLIM